MFQGMPLCDPENVMSCSVVRGAVNKAKGSLSDFVHTISHTFICRNHKILTGNSFNAGEACHGVTT